MTPLPFGLAPDRWTNVEGRYVVDRYVKCLSTPDASKLSSVPSPVNGELQNELRAYVTDVVADLQLPPQDRQKRKDRAEQDLDREIERLTASRGGGQTEVPDDKAYYQALLRKRQFVQDRANYATAYLRGADRYEAAGRIRAELADVDRRLAPYAQREKAAKDLLDAFRVIEKARYKLDWCSSEDVGFVDRQRYEQLSTAVGRLESFLLDKHPNSQAIREIMSSAEADAGRERKGYDELIAKGAETNYMLYGRRGSLTARDFPQLGVECRTTEIGLSTALRQN